MPMTSEAPLAPAPVEGMLQEQQVYLESEAGSMAQV